MDIQKKKIKKADFQISNLRFHLCKQYCYFLYLQKKKTFQYSELDFISKINM